MVSTALTDYGVRTVDPAHRPRRGPWLSAAVAAATVLAVWGRAPAFGAATGLVMGMIAAACAVGSRGTGVAWLRTIVVLACTIVGVVGAMRGANSWAGLTPDELGPFTGWARLVDDPRVMGAATRIVVEVDGERYEVWIRGRAAQQRAATWRGGDQVVVSGARERLDDQRARRVASQHVVGVFALAWAGDVRPGSAIDVASNRVRGAIERAASVLPGDDGSLYRGLVIGDDRDQPAAMLERFRTSGLSHLTAVSGQNVSYVLLAFGPLLRSMPPWWRLALTLALVAWFVSMTRFEPSILRAGVMAGLSATAFTLGRERAPVDLLAGAVTALVVIDPLLIWSVGFWLSVGATAGVCVVAPLLLRCGHGRLAGPLAVTVGAQVGVALPSLLVFGRLPLVGVVANLLAVPVAGFVMLYGLPAGLLAGNVPAIAPLVMLPVRIGTRWVDTVAVVGAAAEPVVGPGGWIALAIVAMVAWWSLVRWSRHRATR